MPHVTRGVLAGAIASLPMLAAMELLEHVLPGEMTDRPVPPRIVAMRIADRAGLARRMDEPERVGWTLLSHVGFGASMGGTYGAVAPHVPLPPAAKGVGFGLLVWAASYAGWLPLTGIIAPPPRRPLRRNVMIVLAHLLWGALLGAMAEIRPRARL